MSPRRRLRLLAAIGVIACPGCWSTGRGAAEIYYLHLYSTLYDIQVPARDYGTSENRRRRDNQCIATIAITPGVGFYANLPNHYEPEMRIEGLVERHEDAFRGELTILLLGVDVAYQYDLAEPLPLDERVRLDEEPFHLAIATAADPYALKREPD